MSSLTLSPEAVADMRAACEDAYPREACGLLLGRSAEARRVLRVVVARNLDPSASRFVLDPVDFVRADGLARDAGMEIVGVFHSHPDQPARPSREDEAAAQPGWSHVIASVQGDGAAGCVADMTSWALPKDATQRLLTEERIEWDADERDPRSC